MVYLFLGQDSPSKDIQLNRLRQNFLTKDTEQFNLDIVYAKELTLKGLQEKLLCLPVNNSKRIIVVKETQELREEIKGFIIQYVKKPYPEIILVLDITAVPARKGGLSQQGKLGEFLNHIYKYVKICRFREALQLDTFTLNRQINLKRPDYALRVLNQLLRDGERPELILGGLRYAIERAVAHPLEMRKRFRLLLNCDMDIKRGKLRPAFALERLVIALCGVIPPTNKLRAGLRR